MTCIYNYQLSTLVIYDYAGFSVKNIITIIANIRLKGTIYGGAVFKKK